MKRKWLVFLAIALLLSGTGCWDMLDIEKQGFVLTLGIDTIKSQEQLISEGIPEASSDLIQVTMEILSPQLMKKKEGKATFVLSQDAGTVEEALRLAQGQIARKISLAHLRAVIVGEDFARKGIKDLIDYLEKHPRTADRIRITFIQDKRAEDVIRMPLVSEKSVADIITKMGELDVFYAFHCPLNFNEFLVLLKTNNGTCYATRHYLSETGWLIKSGAAVIKDWKLAGWLDAYAVRRANWITGRMNQATVSAQAGEMRVTYNIVRTKTHTEPYLVNGQPRFLVKIKTDGHLVQLENGIKQIDPKVHKELEGALAQHIKGEAEKALAEAQQKYQADYLNIGQSLFNTYPAVYQNSNWPEVFPRVPVEVQVEARITRFSRKR